MHRRTEHSGGMDSDGDTAGTAVVVGADDRDAEAGEEGIAIR